MSLSIASSTKTILIVEDNPEDYETTIRAFNKSGLSNPTVWCEDGDQALDYLYRHKPYDNPTDSPRPSIILLDLNLPGTDGYEVLADIKKNPELASIPVIVLTTSDSPKDIDACYQAGANSYVQKPVDTQGFVAAIEKLKDYWFEIVILPNGETS